jgi:hypothetical protein
MVILILTILYILPAVLGFIIYYVHWCKNDKEGYTIADMNQWMSKNVTLSDVRELFIPLFNWAIMIFAISDVFGDDILNLRIRRNAKPTKTKRH